MACSACFCSKFFLLLPQMLVGLSLHNLFGLLNETSPQILGMINLALYLDFVFISFGRVIYLILWFKWEDPVWKWFSWRIVMKLESPRNYTMFGVWTDLIILVFACVHVDWIYLHDQKRRLCGITYLWQ